VPRGFDPAHERVRFLLHQGLWAEFDGAAGSPGDAGFVDVCFGHFAVVAPVARWLLAEVVSAD
jgi:hypothetical protein